MTVLVGVLASLAAAAVFFFIEPYLLELDQSWRLVGTVVVFVASAGLAMFFHKKSSGEKPDGSAIISDNVVKKDMTAKISGLETTQPANKVLSGNKVSGNADFEIKDSKL